MTDFGDTVDPFRCADPPILLFGTLAERFELAWLGAARCPICSGGPPVARGRTARLALRWLRFSCGHVATVETSAAGMPGRRGTREVRATREARAMPETSGTGSGS